MPRCPKDSHIKIGLYRNLVKSVAGGERTELHREATRRMSGKCGAFPLCPWSEGGALGHEVPHCGGEPPALTCCDLPYFEVKVDLFYAEPPAFSVLYTLL